MALEFEKITFLKIYTGEDVMLEDKPLYKAIIEDPVSYEALLYLL